MKSKQEIIESNTKAVSLSTGGYLEKTDIESSMDQWAEQETFDFIKWANEMEWYYDNDSKEWFHNHFTQLYTNDEMWERYTRYKQLKNESKG